MTSKLIHLRRSWHYLACLIACLNLTFGCGRDLKTQKAETSGGEEFSSQDFPGQKLVQQIDIGSKTADSPFRFTDMAEEAGVTFTYYGNPSQERYMTEQNGGGVALFDIDGDNQLDVFLVNGSHFDHPAEEVGASNCMYRSSGTWSFTDVTVPAGLQAFGFGMGCTAGDFDNDGFGDLFVCYYGRNLLYRNNGDGTFSDVTTETNTGDDQWATSAAFADLDDDGNLDLYVVNYVDYSSDEPPCFSGHSHPIQISCSPLNRSGQADLLYHNRGDGTFEEIGEAAGIARPEQGKGLALQIVDLDDDNRLDIYVANDTTDNFLFRNCGDMKFEEVGRIWGVAVSDSGTPQASMGIACADINQDQRLDLLVTNFAGAVNDYYENLSPGLFAARNSQLGLDPASRPMLSFGTLFVDFDLDHWPDLFIANGHIWDLGSVDLHHQYEMSPLLFQNQSGEWFGNVSSTAGEYFAKKSLGRSAAVGDLDNDGLPDLVVTHMAAPVALLKNDSPHRGNAVRLRLVGTSSARQPFGRRVTYAVDGKHYVGVINSGGSFQSSQDPRLLIPVGEAEYLEELCVYWDAGDPQVWTNLPLDAELTITEKSQ